MKGRLGHVVLLAVLLTACTAPTPLIPTPTAPVVTVTPRTLRLVCSESLLPAFQGLVSVYQQRDPTVQILLIERADALILDALRSGEAEAAALVWLPATLPPTAWKAAFARDGLAVVVNPQNGVPGLTVAQLQELFQGRAEDWALWGGLPGPPVVVSREDAAGDFAAFQTLVMGNARVSLTALLAPSSEAVLRLVGEEPLAVGYVSTARLDNRVRPLAVEGIPPTSETLISAVYPLTRDLYVLTLGEPRGAARPFIQWLLGPEGQAVLAAHGLVPIAAP